MGMIARHGAKRISMSLRLWAKAGREVREFIKKIPCRWVAKSVWVVATSINRLWYGKNPRCLGPPDREYFRDRMECTAFDGSLTRLRWHNVKKGMSVGEPPVTRGGYTPSVFKFFLDIAGTFSVNAERGLPSRGLYTVLVEGDDMNEPFAILMRGIFGGHIVLSRKLAHRNHIQRWMMSSVSRSCR
jgi:flagellum-specific ATP synthase